MLKAAQAVDDRADHILIIGHNPGTQMLAEMLAAPTRSDKETISRIREKYPTCALTSFLFDISAWKDLKAGAGELALFATPKEISGNP